MVFGRNETFTPSGVRIRLIDSDNPRTYGRVTTGPRDWSGAKGLLVNISSECTVLFYVKVCMSVHVHMPQAADQFGCTHILHGEDHAYVQSWTEPALVWSNLTQNIRRHLTAIEVHIHLNVYT